MLYQKGLSREFAVEEESKHCYSNPKDKRFISCKCSIDKFSPMALTDILCCCRPIAQNTKGKKAVTLCCFGFLQHKSCVCFSHALHH
jgi:hypothetical protein